MLSATRASGAAGVEGVVEEEFDEDGAEAHHPNEHLPKTSEPLLKIADLEEIAWGQLRSIVA